MTDLKGRYDFTLDFSRFDQADGPPPDEMTATITVVQQQLGLKLESRKAPIEVLVIDNANKVPIEN